MSYNEKEKENAEIPEITETGRHTEPKGNYVIYTIISIALFFLIFFGYKLITGYIGREYYMKIDGNDLTGESAACLKDFTGIDLDSISSARFERKNHRGYAVICYNNIGKTEDFAEEYITYEYGDVLEDVRIEIYPYGNDVPEYVFAECYVSIDDPNTLCYVYEYNGESFAEYHSGRITSEYSALFRNSEKMPFQ